MYCVSMLDYAFLSLSNGLHWSGLWNILFCEYICMTNEVKMDGLAHWGVLWVPGILSHLARLTFHMPLLLTMALMLDHENLR